MDDVRIGRAARIPAGELRFRFSRSGGPGGQNVNTRDTRVELLFDLAGSPSLGPRQRARAMTALGSRLEADGTVRVVASSERTQAANRAAAVERFRNLMEEALRPPPPPRRATKPSRAARRRRVDDKKARGQVKRLRSRPPPE